MADYVFLENVKCRDEILPGALYLAIQLGTLYAMNYDLSMELETFRTTNNLSRSKAGNTRQYFADGNMNSIRSFRFALEPHDASITRLCQFDCISLAFI